MSGQKDISDYHNPTATCFVVYLNKEKSLMSHEWKEWRHLLKGTKANYSKLTA